MVWAGMAAHCSSGWWYWPFPPQPSPSTLCVPPLKPKALPFHCSSRLAEGGATKRPLCSKRALTMVRGAGSHPSGMRGGVRSTKSIRRSYIITWELAANYVRQTACKCAHRGQEKYSENSFMLISLIHRKLGEMLCNDNPPPLRRASGEQEGDADTYVPVPVSPRCILAACTSS